MRTNRVNGARCDEYVGYTLVMLHFWESVKLVKDMIRRFLISILYIS